MADAVGRPLVTLTAHYLRPAPAGPCEIEVTTVRSGRRFATATATLTMESGQVLQLLGTFGDQAPGGPSLTREPPAELPDYDDCEIPPPPAHRTFAVVPQTGPAGDHEPCGRGHRADDVCSVRRRNPESAVS